MTTLCWRTCFPSLQWKSGLKCLYVTDTQLVSSDAEKRFSAGSQRQFSFAGCQKIQYDIGLLVGLNKQFPSTESEMCNNRPRWIDLKSTTLKWQDRLSCVSTKQYGSLQYSAHCFSVSIVQAINGTLKKQTVLCQLGQPSLGVPTRTNPYRKEGCYNPWWLVNRVAPSLRR